MTTTTAPNSATQTSSGDSFGEEVLFSRNDDDTLKPVQVKRLSLSPPPQPLQYLQVSHQPRDGNKSSNAPQIHPSQGDVILLATLDGGRSHDIPAQAGEQTLPSISDPEEELRDPSTARLKRRGPASSPSNKAGMSLDLQSMAAAGLAAASLPTADQDPIREAEPTSPDPESHLSTSSADRPLAPLAQQYSSPQRSPAQPDPLNNNLQRLDIHSPPANGHGGDLRPMLSPPKPDSNGKHQKVPLPSIRSTLGDIPDLPDPNHRVPLPPPVAPHYGQSSPAGMSLALMPSHASPPVSPNDRFRHDMPSPSGRSLPGLGQYYPYQSNAPPGRHSVDYSSSSATETPSSDQSASTPSVAERMSIDNMTNPVVGTFVCTFAGCKASPFQTQYLLNSHANVHSSSRPHYCPVKGCPRAEGGRGFKRKNEMIRHGLVHDSPGYVCPFCPDREHKYPRPDNLQRHVRVHHPEKDKDDAALRDVLAQRPDGPNRGRRRRGGQPC